jgi:undecaprenyl phosphate-alpha-L-ara4N flippase subunit ArnE
MLFPQMFFTILTVIALSFGQILFKIAAKDFDFSSNGMLYSIFNLKLLAAFLVYFIATLMWIFVLKTSSLQIAYPFVALAFFIVPILAHFLLGESLRWNNFVGAGFIAVGVWISVYGIER